MLDNPEPGVTGRPDLCSSHGRGERSRQHLRFADSNSGAKKKRKKKKDALSDPDCLSLGGGEEEIKARPPPNPLCCEIGLKILLKLCHFYNAVL